MAHFTGKIEKSTGALLAAGFCDFKNDGSFDAATHEIIPNAPHPPKCKGQPGETTMDRWNGSAWVTVPQP